MKKINIDVNDEGIPSTALREISVLRELSDTNHPNIVKLIDVVYHNSLWLIFEYLQFDLKQFLDRDKEDLSDRMLQSFLRQLLEGVYCCHSHRVLHRDLKPTNILVNQDKHGNYILKLADFGLSRSFDVPVKPITQEVVTLWYRAPEILLGDRYYSTPVDIWSIACIFVELVTRRPLFPGDSEIDQLFKIFRALGTPDESVWTGVTKLPAYQVYFPQYKSKVLTLPPRADPAKSLVLKMLQYEPAKRISAQRALQDDYFKIKFPPTTLKHSYNNNNIPNTNIVTRNKVL